MRVGLGGLCTLSVSCCGGTVLLFLKVVAVVQERVYRKHGCDSM